MIRLSKRLKEIAKIVLSKESNKIIDVGCDHALLDIYLLQNNENLKIVASDNKELPLENAKKNIEKYSFLNKIEVCLKDGINNIDKDIDTVVISGMGMETIVDILEKDKEELKHINRLIISSNNKYQELRKKINSYGYIINDERIVHEYGKYYIIIEFIKGKQKYSDKELYFGPILLNNKNEMFNNYYSFIRDKKIEIVNNLSEEKKQKFYSEIDLIKKEIKNN